MYSHCVKKHIYTISFYCKFELHVLTLHPYISSINWSSLTFEPFLSLSNFNHFFNPVLNFQSEISSLKIPPWVPMNEQQHSFSERRACIWHGQYMCLTLTFNSRIKTSLYLCHGEIYFLCNFYSLTFPLYYLLLNRRKQVYMNTIKTEKSLKVIQFESTKYIFHQG